MRLVILGAGALGSILRTHLARAGEEVTLLARGPRAQWIQTHGLTITGLANFTVPVNVTVHPAVVQEADILLVAVKTYHTESALKSVRHLEVESVLSVQNGVFKNEQLARRFEWEKPPRGWHGIRRRGHAAPGDGPVSREAWHSSRGWLDACQDRGEPRDR